MANSLVLAESPKLSQEVELEAERLVFRPIGSIDEDTSFSSIIQHVGEMGKKIKTLEIDLGQVKSLNSCGVRAWILLLEMLPQDLLLEFTNINPLFVEQASMIPNMLGKKGCPVNSFQAPYYCDACHADVTKLMLPDQLSFDGIMPVLPEFPCEKCKKPLTFDSIEEEYFAFLKRR